MPDVGGRMEAVAPQRSLFGPDYLRMAAVGLVAVAVHGWLIANTAVTARDGIGFARYALALQTPAASVAPPDENRTALDVIKDEKQHHPPGYPVAVWATAKVVHRVAPGLPLPDSMLLATQLVSAAAGVLLVVPIYLIGRVLFGRNVGFAAALLFETLPVPARVTSDGMTEGLYLLAAATALLLGVRAVRRPSVGGFLLCGLFAGASYLVRPEGLMIVGAVGAVAAGNGLTRRWPRDLTLGRLAALAVGAVMVAGPYVLLIGKLSQKPSATNLTPPFVNPRSKLMGEGASAAPASGGGGPVFATWWHIPDGAGPVEVVAPAVVGVFKESGKSLHYSAAVLAVFGLFALRRRVATDPGLAVLLALAGLNAAVLVAHGTTGYYVGKRTMYVSEHHTLLIALIGCEFAAAGLAALPRFGRGRVVPAVLLLAVVAASLPATLRPLHDNREGHKHAGRWLKGVLEEHETRGEPVTVIDPFCWAEWYAGRSLHCIPPDSKDARVRYSILDRKDRENDHERLPRFEQAKAVSAAGKIVYWWPETVPEEQAEVRVYKTVGPSDAEQGGK